MLYPVPAVMVSCCREGERPNIITVAWAGTICSDPAMVSISVRPSRYSHDIIKDSGEFVINLVTEDLTPACDWCGVRSGKDVDKFAYTWTDMQRTAGGAGPAASAAGRSRMHGPAAGTADGNSLATGTAKVHGLTPGKASKLEHAPIILESPVSIECKVKQIIPLGSHDMFLGEVVAVDADEAFFDKKGRFDLSRAGLIAYSHGEYFGLGRRIGSFGYSVKKK